MDFVCRKMAETVSLSPSPQAITGHHSQCTLAIAHQGLAMTVYL
jgi:hypothetical protein